MESTASKWTRYWFLAQHPSRMNNESYCYKPVHRDNRIVPCDRPLEGEGECPLSSDHLPLNGGSEPCQ